MKKNILAFSVVLGLSLANFLQAANGWYERINLRGYSQFRYNRIFETNPLLKCDQCDKSWGDKGGLFFRRIRMIFSGELDPRVSFYIQPDFASMSNGDLNFGQIRDAYFDLYLEKDLGLRLRVGQSKVPFGFENLQSSSNRLPLDRNDALNSAVPNERDTGVFFYWTPPHIAKLYQELSQTGNLKGSGDYGLLGLGAYNGQSANKPEINNQLHWVARLTYPWQFENGQILETSLQGYTGQIVTPTTLSNSNSFLDQRVAASLVLYPKPFGLQAEYNIGTSPEFQTSPQSIGNSPLYGGYLLTQWRYTYEQQLITPFARWQFFRGGKKLEQDARSYDVNELELGVEWQMIKALELTAAYTFSNRRFENSSTPNNSQQGRLLRLQVQVNY